MAFYSWITWLGHLFQLIGFVFRVEYKLWTCHYSNFVLHVNQFQVTWLICDSLVSVDCWTVLPCGTPSTTRHLKQRRFWATAANQKWTFMHYWKLVLPKRLGKLALWEWPHLAIGNRPLRGFQDKLLCLVVFPLYLNLFWELRDRHKKLWKIAILTQKPLSQVKILTYRMWPISRIEAC